MKKGFTLIEMLVVVGIIMLLAAFLVPAFSGSGESAKASKCLANMRQIAVAVQGRGMQTRTFPLAGSVTKYKTQDVRAGTKALHGWIGWSTDQPGGSYISPYSTDSMARYYSMTNGSIWRAAGRNHDIFICPLHREATRRQLRGGDKYGPCWSYVMNARFGWQYYDGVLPYTYGGMKFVHDKSATSERYCRIPSKTLLIAELPFITNEFQSPEYNQGPTVHNDPILQYEDCDGNGDEIIGFNHKLGKRDYYAHVCFVDGHVEKFKLPAKADENNLRQLTKWLCYPECEDVLDDDGNLKYVQDFDIVLRGDKYEPSRASN